MAEEPEGVAAPAEEEAEAPAAEPAEPSSPFDVSLSAAQISEIWKAPTDEAGLALLGRCLGYKEDTVEEDLRTQIGVDMLFKAIDCAKTSALAPAKAKAFLDVFASMHKHCVETMCGKEDAFAVFKEGILSATKALPLAQRFSLEEVTACTGYVSTSYLMSLKLHQLVFTEEQTLRESAKELFLQTPAVPPATSEAVDPEELAREKAEAEAAAKAEADAAAAAAEAAAAPPAEEISYDAPPAEEAPAAEESEEDALTAAIAKTISSQVAAVQQQVAAEYAAEEQKLLDRIGALESKLG